MKHFLTTFIVLIISIITYGQRITSGTYGDGLKLSFDSTTKRITGYYESYSGWDEQSKSAQFSCIFFIEGTVTGNTFQINTYFPADKSEDQIAGTMEIVDEKNITIKLPTDHGGCWNVQNFSSEPVKFTLTTSNNSIQISYVDNDKTYFHLEKSDAKKLKSYLVKGDVVSIEKIENGWAYAAYYGKKVTKGWLKLQDLNK